MSEQGLSERKRLILKAIVEAHVLYGEPIGSKSLLSNQQLTCSSATIRNEMAELESMGYLEQPHTSAGRVPTELGYRFYVDSLAKQYRMTSMELEQINRTLQRKMGELDRILEDASRLLSRFTNYAGIAFKPSTAQATVSRFESAYLDEHSLVLVMVFSDGTVKTGTVYTELSLSQEELSAFIAVLNQQLCGLTSSEITLPRIVNLERSVGLLSALVHPVITCIYNAMSELDSGAFRVDGVNHLLEYPEYADVGQFKEMLNLLENKEDLASLISDGSEGRDLQVHIGSENALDAMSNSSFVYRLVRRNGQVVGAVGVIGPRRMDYSRVIALLNQLSLGISGLIGSDEAGGGALPDGKK
ncbi:MAG: heat-inducible transcription repressor HrcA [Clostridia bacterium]|nr:heat-inducible transcription repressor HrcA [Clostridia bacterium]